MTSLPETLSPASRMQTKTKIGLLGLNFGRTIIDQLALAPTSDYFELTALCDQNAVALAKVLPGSEVARYGHLDELLEDDDVEAIGLFTGPVGRAALIRKIIRTGRHVITTKPLEMDADAMRDVLLEAKERGCVVHANSPTPILTQDLQLIQDWVREYNLGRPVGCHADVWASYRETPDGTWYDDAARCPSPPIFRLGIYLINDLVRLWGKVEKVQIMESRIFTGRPTSDNSELSLLFENKALATIYASFCVNDGDHYRNGLTLNYENGTIYRNAGPAWASDTAGASRLALVKNLHNRPVVIAEEKVTGTSGSYEWKYFHDAICGQIAPDELSADQMVEGIRVIQEMVKISQIQA